MAQRKPGTKPKKMSGIYSNLGDQMEAAVFNFLVDNSQPEVISGRGLLMICREPIYPYLRDTYDLSEADARRWRSRAMKRLRAAGKVERLSTRGLAVVVL